MKENAYLLQAALIACWLLGLFTQDDIFEAFQFAGIGPEAFWSFFLPDALLIGCLSLIRGYWKSNPLEWIVLGAFGYATLYCINATLLTRSGLLPTGLMVLGLCFNLFLCFGERSFRQLRSRGFKFNLLKTLLQVVCIWFMALVLIPSVLLNAFPPADVEWFSYQQAAGLLLLVLASLLGLISAFHMVKHGDGTPLPLDQTSRLVVTGPYQFVRNPMAVAGIGQGIGIAVIYASVPVFIYALVGAVIWHAAIRPMEERDLEARFGADYDEYRRRTRCWIPIHRLDVKESATEISSTDSESTRT